MLTLASIFRDSAHQVGTYFDQVAELRKHVDVRLALAEGDSTDDTFRRLDDSLSRGDLLVKIDHNGYNFGSVDHPVRWDQIAVVVSGLIKEIGDPGDRLIWVESDLWWSPETMLTLISDTDAFPAVAPLVLATDGNRFYDTWGFRKDGEKFEPRPPYYPPSDDPIVPIDSCGSCFVASPDVYPVVREWSGHWPFTAGGDLWLDSTVAVTHP